MKTPIKTPITRASLLTTASSNTRWFASLLASTSVLGSAAMATVWDGDVSSDWNDNLNWAGDAGNSLDVTININPVTNPPYVAKISANSTQTARDIFVGIGAATDGRLDHTAGTAATGGGNWFEVGVNAGTGTYNLADTASAGGVLTGMGLGTGSMTVGGRLYVGGSEARNGGGSTGTVNVNTSGTLAINGDLSVGIRNCVGVMKIDAGTVTTNGWTYFGRELGLAGGNGSFSIGGGTLTNTNGNARAYVGLGNATGSFSISGGTYNNVGTSNDNQFAVGVNNLANATTPTLTMTGGTINARRLFTVGGTEAFGGNSGETGPGKGTATVNGAGALLNVTGEFWVGQGAGSTGTLNINAGTIQTNSWIAIGRGTGTGNVTMTGGTWNKTASGQFIVGAGGPGTMTMSGGLVDVQGGFTWVGETAAATTAVLTISGSAEFNTSTMSVGQSAPDAILNLNGGTLRTQRFHGSREENDTGASGGTGTVNFNGSQIIATANNLTNFISTTLDNAVIGTGGLLINSNGFNLTAPKSLSGAGGVVKSGSGSLTLSGFNTYAGNNVVSAGTLVLSAEATGTGSISMANGTTLGITAPFAGDQLTASAATFGTAAAAATTVNLNLGDLNGVNPVNSILDVTGALVVDSVITINVAGAKFGVGNIPLVSYNAAQLSGGGAIVLGSLPPGVVATLVNNPNFFGPGLGAAHLNVTSVALPEWDGSNEVLLAKFADTVATSANVTVTDASGILVGQTVRGPGIPAATTVTAINGLIITLSQPATATGSLVDLRFVVTAGTNDGVWNTTTKNWTDQVTTLSSLYADPNPVLFSDLATGPTAVVLNSTVNPSQVTFNNSTLVYSLSGTGSISGSTGLLKQGTAGLTVSTANNYLGVTRLEGGTTTVATLTSGGVASPLGAATSAPANLVLAGGTLDYTGGAVSIDRGLTIDGNSGLVNAGNLTLTGQLLRTNGGITKTGAGSLTLSNASNAIGAFRVNQGSLAFDGSGGPQTNTANGLFLGAGVTVVLPNNTTLACAGDVNIGDLAGAASTFTLSGNAVFSTPNRVMTGVGNVGASGAIMVSGSSQFNMTGGWLSVGQTGSGSLTVKDSGKFSMTGADFNISDLGGSNGSFTLQDLGTVNVTTTFWGKGAGSTAAITISGGTYTNTGSFFVSDNTSSTTVTQTGGTIANTGGELMMGRDGTAVWTQTAGTVSSSGWTILGRNASGNGTWNISGGSLTQTQLDRPFMIGEFGKGTLNVSGTADVTSLGNNGLILANEPAGTGVVNLNGGTLTAKRVREGNDGNGGNGGTSTFNFNGGVLKAATGANANFMSGLNKADLLAGGGTIDSNGVDINIAQSIGGSGALTKTGAGKLTFTGSNTYGGNTTVVDGILSLTAPNLGNFTTVTIGIVPLSPAVLDLPNAGTDFVSGLVIDGAPVGPGIYGAPGSGATFETNAISGSGFLQVATPSAYDSWVAGPAGAFPGSNDPLVIGPAADPDGDGQSNGLEFALGGAPNSGSNNAKVYNLTEDSGDAGNTKELLMTIAVRSGAPAFAGSPSPTATKDGATYTIQGSLDLTTFTSPVSVVAPVTIGLPAAPAGYEYRTFSLDGSDGLPLKGFLRVNVTP